MSSEKYFVIVILAFAACAVVAKPNGMTLALVKDQTVCRTKVEYDTDEDRIPKTIKIIKCEDDPYEICPASNGESMPCCGALTLGGAVKFSCTEVQDDVVVMYNKNQQTTRQTFKVAIGCSCIKQDSNKAME